MTGRLLVDQFGIQTHKYWAWMDPGNVYTVYDWRIFVKVTLDVLIKLLLPHETSFSRYLNKF